MSFDPNVRLAVEPDADAWRAALAAILPHASVVKMSDEDASVLLPGVSPAEVASRLAAGGRLVVVTAGSRGAHAATPSARAHVPAPPTDVVDTIGAGDSFMAATVAWLARRDWPDPAGLGAAGLAELGDYAAAAAALTCSRAGADLPWAAELAS
ncbi:PfkB family carbohydrate kinase [Nocardioides sp. TF02-7]|uniref:PfkB family carbohydrate kinase n=1 Tax=Nocardioides sp. TF02-7 TaxID=2917724 RepID=UPI0023DCC22C|nr:PfkB family carbohydrate kinase [Nocardioides sp. TF02-7]